MKNVEYNKVVYDLDVNSIEVDYEYNTRDFSQMDCADLQRSIRESGQSEPGKVVHQPDKEKPFFLISGFRRMHVIRDLLKQETYRAIVVPPCSESERLKYTFIENHARKDLTLYDEAMVMKRFFDLGYNESEVMRELGLSRGYTQPRFMLLKMMNQDEELIPLAKAGQLNATVCRDLFKISDSLQRKEAIDEIKRKVKFKLKVSIDATKYDTKKPRDEMLMERKKPHRKAFMEWAYGNGIPFNGWQSILAWINGDKTDLELYDELDAMIADPCSYSDFSELIEDAESYTHDPDGFLARVLAFKEEVATKSLNRPDNGIPAGS